MKKKHLLFWWIIILIISCIWIILFKNHNNVNIKKTKKILIENKNNWEKIVDLNKKLIENWIRIVNQKQNLKKWIDSSKVVKTKFKPISKLNIIIISIKSCIIYNHFNKNDLKDAYKKFNWKIYLSKKLVNLLETLTNNKYTKLNVESNNKKCNLIAKYNDWKNLLKTIIKLNSNIITYWEYLKNELNENANNINKKDTEKKIILITTK